MSRIIQPNSSHKNSKFILEITDQQLQQEQVLSVLNSLGFSVNKIKVKPAIKYFYCASPFNLLSETKKTELLLYITQPNTQPNLFANINALDSLFAVTSFTLREIFLIKTYLYYLLQNKVIKEHMILEFYIKNIEFLQDFLKSFKLKFDPYCSKLTLENKSLQATDHLHLLLLEALKATVRTNFYQNKDYISLKFMPRILSWHRSIQPLYEFFVYGASVVGIHMRFDKIARGGIRFSDRLDLREEVLALAQAQLKKNALIVPSGAKGAFFDNDNNLVRGFKTFISSMLELCDNFIDGQISKPELVVAYDDDDTYLVVAADKGTANLSDLANKIAIEYGFWLHDAFCSGGSNGYNHKKIGITSLGAFEILKNHFSSLGKSMDSSPFTVLGIGDMSGDVFGNAMLLSENILLLGAFNRDYIFIDPNPDRLVAFQERSRLFSLGLNWSSYKADLISKGGNVFLRADKNIVLNTILQKFLHTTLTAVSGSQLIKLLFLLKVDLIFNGGIGTYIKAKNEALDYDLDNKEVRIAASKLGAKILVEGGNLGITNLGRLEFAKKGGRINTDFFDNAAAVMCSDYEVNLKILLQQALRKQQLTLTQYKHKIQELQVEVLEKVLGHIRTQIHALDQMMHHPFREETCTQISHSIKVNDADYALMLEDYAEDGYLGWSLRPKLANLLSISRIFLKSSLAKLNLNHLITPLLSRYFPAHWLQDLSLVIQDHPIKQKICETMVANLLIEYIGLPVLSLLIEATKLNFLTLLVPLVDFIRSFPLALLQKLKEQQYSGMEHLLFTNIYTLCQEKKEQNQDSSLLERCLVRTLIALRLDQSLSLAQKNYYFTEITSMLLHTKYQKIAKAAYLLINVNGAPSHHESKIEHQMEYRQYITRLINHALLIEQHFNNARFIVE